MYAEENIRSSALNEYSYASRKIPEYMHHRLMLCLECDIVFADPTPSEAELERAYTHASFDAGTESRYAARTYARAFRRVITGLSSDAAVLDVGAGDGAFLEELTRAGLGRARGVEPSVAPFRAAAEPVRSMIFNRAFRASDFSKESYELVSCFQTLEHLPDPAGFCAEVNTLLKKGGVFIAVCHDRRAWPNLLMGRRSPIFDIEHLQLFSSKSVRRMLGSAGFARLRVFPLYNIYPLRYWIRLAPLGPLKSSAVLWASRAAAGSWPVGIFAGNIGIEATKVGSLS